MQREHYGELQSDIAEEIAKLQYNQTPLAEIRQVVKQGMDRIVADEKLLTLTGEEVRLLHEFRQFVVAVPNRAAIFQFKRD